MGRAPPSNVHTAGYTLTGLQGHDVDLLATRGMGSTALARRIVSSSTGGLLRVERYSQQGNLVAILRQLSSDSGGDPILIKHAHKVLSHLNSLLGHAGEVGVPIPPAVVEYIETGLFDDISGAPN